MRGRWLVAGASVALVVSGTATFITLHGGHKEPVASLTVVDEPGTTPTPDVNLTQLASPSAEATAAPSTTADSRNSPDPADASGALPARCRGPLPPGHPADPSCDALHPHSGLPHPCIGIRYSCGWPDAHGAVPGGQTSMNVDVRGTTLHVTWTSEDLAGGRSQGPVHEFVIRLARPNTEDVLVTRRLPIDVFSTDFTGLAPGTYEVICYELNDSGLGAGFADTYTIAAPPTHPPSPSPTPKPTPTASAAPSATPTP